MRTHLKVFYAPTPTRQHVAVCFDCPDMGGRQQMRGWMPVTEHDHINAFERFALGEHRALDGFEWREFDSWDRELPHAGYGPPVFMACVDEYGAVFFVSSDDRGDGNWQNMRSELYGMCEGCEGVSVDNHRYSDNGVVHCPDCREEHVRGCADIPRF